MKAASGRKFNVFAKKMEKKWNMSESILCSDNHKIKLKDQSGTCILMLSGGLRRRAYRLGMSGGKSHQHAQNTSGEWRKTLNNPPCPITPSWRYHLYIIHLVNGLHCFYGITMSLKWPLVPKSDAKQQFTTTMCVKKCICLYLETKLNQHRVLYNCTWT